MGTKYMAKIYETLDLYKLGVIDIFECARIVINPRCLQEDIKLFKKIDKAGYELKYT